MEKSDEISKRYLDIMVLLMEAIQQHLDRLNRTITQSDLKPNKHLMKVGIAVIQKEGVEWIFYHKNKKTSLPNLFYDRAIGDHALIALLKQLEQMP